VRDRTASPQPSPKGEEAHDLPRVMPTTSDAALLVCDESASGHEVLVQRVVLFQEFHHVLAVRKIGLSAAFHVVLYSAVCASFLNTST